MISKLILKYTLNLLLFKFYPKTTSRTIISAKPMAKPIVPRLLCSPCCEAGINSSTTTYSMAPAEKDSNTGMAGRVYSRNSRVMTAAIGSTIPDSVP